ncbi:D-alanyl-D-alanine dipeptidase [Ferrovibrio sp.]|uniref:D-alanyl-D-alanine dipeptidase n=1 Tax=Ferrovibrio sp. TaxID=1917215 RepID=UPI0035AFB717
MPITPILIKIAPPDFDVEIDLRYATNDNITGQPVYRRAAAFLNEEAAEKLAVAIRLAAALGYRFRIFDAFRPTEAQWTLWNHTPDPNFLADPRRGSPHSRGAAVDLNLIDPQGHDLDMGTAFDAFTPLSHHGRTDITVAAQRNRAVLLGLMTAAGWDFYRNEWWHYQLFDAKRHPLLSDAEAGTGMM